MSGPGEPPRQVLRTPPDPARTTGRRPGVAPRTGAASRSDPLLQRTRPRRLVDLVAELDAVAAGPRLDELIGRLDEEFGLPGMPPRPLGMVARCYLGPPYEVHVLDLAGHIVEHFEMGRRMPGRFEQARPLALHGAYAFVEVTDTGLRAVRPDGSVSTVSGGEEEGDDE